jgi:hypothetical protein
MIGLNELDLAFRVVGIVSAIVSSAAAFLAWRYSRRAEDWATTEFKYHTFAQLEQGPISDAYLEVYGITSEDLSRHGLDRNTLAEYLRVTHRMWLARLTDRELKHLSKKKFSHYEEGLFYVRKKGHVFDPSSPAYRIARSTGFQRAWPLLQQFWTRSGTSYLSMVIEATMDSAICHHEERLDN